MPARPLLRRALLAGVITGIVVIYLGAVGMIELFETRRLISNIVTLGKVLLCLPPFVVGYLVVRPRVRRGEVEGVATGPGIAAGTIAGAVGGAVTVAWLLLVHAIGVDSVRLIFVSISPTLVETVQFGQELAVAAAILILGGAALGAAGAGFRALPQLVRRPLAVGLLTTALFALLQRILPPALDQLHVERDWLYSKVFLGLTVTGAVIVFVVSTAAAMVWRAVKAPLRARVNTVSEGGRKGGRYLGLAVLLVLLAALPTVLNDQLRQVLGTVAIFLLMGLGLNIVVGFAGLLDLGYVAFFAVGAYVTALLTSGRLVISLGGSATPALHSDLTFYEALPFVILVTAVIGLLIGAPVLRLRGDYLAIVTLGFGEIARILVQSDWFKPLVGGAQGMTNITNASIFGQSFRDPKWFYWLALFFCLIAIFVAYRLADSRIGRAWNAMREDEQVAEAMGISTVRYKLLAFATGAAIGCLGGALFAVQVGSLNPATSFTILVSITVLAVIILGGMGSIPGVVVGALLLIGIPNLLSEFERYRLLMYGAVLVAIMGLRPQGMIPNVRRSRELHEEEVEQDAWFKRTGDASTETAVAVGPGSGSTGEVEIE